MSRLERIAQAGYLSRFNGSASLSPRRHESGRTPALEDERRPAWRMHRSHASTLQSQRRQRNNTVCGRNDLYPWVCKYFKFLFGNPTIHLECEYIPAMLAKEELVRCTVLPPRNLYHPVLPYRCNGRLLFYVGRAQSGLSREVLSLDEFGEGFDRHLCRG
jgi:hypothetical protein